MRIAIDAIGIERPGGGRSILLGLLRGILEVDQKNEYLTIVSTEEPELYQFSNLKQKVVEGTDRLAVRVKAQMVLPGLLQKENIDLVHFSKNLGVFGVRCKSIATIYDMTILNHPSFFPKIDVAYWQLVQRLFLKSVDKIGALSETTKRDLIKYYHLPPEKIEVIYIACDPIFRPLPNETVEQVRIRYRIPQQYILTTANISPKKNLDTLVKSLALLKREYKLPHKLVIAGREYWSGSASALKGLIASLNLQDDVILPGAVVGEDLVALYNRASLFAFPSLDEGFGVVLVEAMACGTPVVASSTTAIPEVVGEAGILLKDPRNHDELAAAMARVLTDETLRQSLVERGFQRAKRFSWRKAGSEYVRLYEQVMSQN